MPVGLTFDGQPVEVLISGLENAAKVTAADILYALNRQKTRILDRTSKGVDADGAPFAPYSTKGPYYFYPGRAAKNRRAAASRFARKTGETRTSVGVKYASYAAFKQALGRSVVDLMGPTAPHMLQAIVVRSGGGGQGTIGIYGNEADRAEGHNTGAGHLPKREFFAFGEQDTADITADIESLMSARLGKLLN